MAEWHIDSRSELLRPESLSQKQLVSSLIQARVPFKEEEASRDDLVTLFYEHVTPRPQRTARKRRNGSYMDVDTWSETKTSSLQTEKATARKRKMLLSSEDQPALKRCIPVVVTSRKVRLKQMGDEDLHEVTKPQGPLIVDRKRHASAILSDSNLPVISGDKRGPEILQQSAAKRTFHATSIKWP